jgi:hypothetical protein
MKIASFNINNIRKRLPNLLNWLREAGPDHHRGARGVAILSRRPEK